ncbi:MAG: ubiquitin-like protein UBact [Fimbriimonadaceae bacterium]|nr:ubiquitin-like protein UBact [Fimbriimonadaceae bacterium]QYK56365.1 MAG: ubiquitin-like protein UBact [Fimbriimonadaceae bacterium]
MTISFDRTLRREFEEPSRKTGDDEGPTKPDIGRPDAPNELLKRMKRVDPEQAKKYRQRSGQ